ncbi:hypothetical protein NHX12_016023 [Muraenolepis orangiensis]|uniref:Uncharacterized protein n=1 Tax=Muraenolepis orangiensis TaxID=630683 RepID=A0A9Q0D4V2_9TELE|nr:hypothetical protein NHX12_016023 [Muraenolepis orangiensis]
MGVPVPRPTSSAPRRAALWTGHHRRSPRSSIHSECMVMPVFRVGHRPLPLQQPPLPRIFGTTAPAPPGWRPEPGGAAACPLARRCGRWRLRPPPPIMLDQLETARMRSAPASTSRCHSAAAPERTATTLPNRRTTDHHCYHRCTTLQHPTPLLPAWTTQEPRARIRHPVFFVHPAQRLSQVHTPLPWAARGAPNDNLDRDQHVSDAQRQSRHPLEHLSHCYPLDAGGRALPSDRGTLKTSREPTQRRALAVRGPCDGLARGGLGGGAGDAASPGTGPAGLVRAIVT